MKLLGIRVRPTSALQRKLTSADDAACILCAGKTATIRRNPAKKTHVREATLAETDLVGRHVNRL